MLRFTNEIVLADFLITGIVLLAHAPYAHIIDATLMILNIYLLAYKLIPRRIK